tara:strand:- start:143 stop:1126 length:984 start_codon:yes stop_codon:yes gene_type:complete
MTMEKNILITGESGFIGSHLVRHFVKKYSNYMIHGLDMLTYASDRNFTISLSSETNYQFHKIDIRDRQQVLNLFSKYKFSDVIHLAAESHVDNSIQNPLIFAETNILGTLNLLDGFRAHSTGRFQHVSTDEVYGDLDINSSAFTEKSNYQPNSPYSASKASSDHFVRAYNKTYDIDVIITNCSNNYGPHQHLEKLIPTVISSIIKNQNIPVYGTGQNIRDWLYVQDHIEALDLVFHGGKNGETYNIGGDNEMSNIDLIHQICGICFEKKYHSDPTKLISFVEDRKGHDRRYSVDFKKINNELGWLPRFEFYNSLVSTIDWYTHRMSV